MKNNVFGIDGSKQDEEFRWHTPEGPPTDLTKTYQENEAAKAAYMAEAPEFYGLPNLGKLDDGSKVDGKGAMRFLSEIEVEAPKWHIKGILPKDSVVVVFGPVKNGKTFVCTDMASCISSGKDYHGHRTTKGMVVYILGEGQRGAIRRFKAWEIHNDAKLGKLALRTAIPLNMPDAADIIIEETKAAENEADEKASVIFVDTLKRNFSGDENTAKDMSGFVSACDKIREAFPDSTIIVVHHSGHTNEHRYMGSMDLAAALDTQFKVEMKGEGENSRIELLANMTREEESWDEPMAFRFKTYPLVDRNGKPLVDEDDERVTGTTIDHIDHTMVNNMSKMPESIKALNAPGRAAADAIITVQGAMVTAGQGFGGAIKRAAILEAFVKTREAAKQSTKEATVNSALSRGLTELVNAGLLDEFGLKEDKTFTKKGAW